MKPWRKGQAGSGPSNRALPGGALVLGMLPVLILVAFLTGRWTAAASGSEGEALHRTTSLVPPAERTEGPQEYTCSMHPQVRTTDPSARCPICGMELIPVEEEHVHDSADPGEPVLRLSPRAAALLQVETYPVERRAVSRRLRLYGQLEVDETRLRTVAARVAGRLERLEVAFTGQEVRAGDPLVAIYSPALISGQEELLQALRAHRALGESSSLAQSSLARLEAARDKLRLLGMAQQEIAALEERGVAGETVVLPAPLDGVVLSREVEAGTYVETGQPLYRLADLSNLWVYLDVPEGEASGLRRGLAVTFQVQALPGERFPGRVAFVEPTVHPEARTIRVRVDLPNPSGRLKPGMFVSGDLELPVEAPPGAERGLPLVIPATAPLLTGERSLVYVQVPGADGPAFEGREVVLGPRAGDWWVVKEGLREGELVVSRGNFRIDAELQIRGRPSLMSLPKGTDPARQGPGAHPTSPSASPLPSEGPQPAAPAPQTPSAFSEQVGSLVQANFRLVIRLAGDDPGGAKAAAREALETLSRADGGLLPASARRSWEVLAGRMRTSLEALLAERDFEAMRGHFEGFSDALTEAVRTFGTGSVGPVYRARCPMVKGREAFWLAPTQEITNPYHGSRMFSCGDIVETLVPPRRGGGRP